MLGGGHPTIVIDGPVAEDFEVLPLTHGRGVRVVESGEERDPIERLLLHAVDGLGSGQLRGFQNRGNDIDDMGELGADATLVFDAGGPRDNHGVARAAQVGGHLFHPLKRCVAGPGPADGIVRFGFRSADGVKVLQVVLDRSRETVEGLHFIERAIGPTFGTRPVVADDVDDQRVVGVGQLVDGVDQASALVVGEGQIARVIFKQTQVKLLLIGGEGVPGGHPFRARREFGIRRDDSGLELPGIGFLADLLPTLIELSLEFVAPFFRRMMRSMGRARGEIEEERFLGCDRLRILHVLDRPVGHVG